MRLRHSTRQWLFLLPNSLTALSMFLGLWAIMLVIDGVRETGGGIFLNPTSLHDGVLIAATWILIAGLIDGLDGAVARMTNTTSNFGVQFDSLSDLVTFGIAPAVVVYATLYPLEPGIATGIAAAYTLAGGVRLARFNAKASATGVKNSFQGLPIPAAAGITMAFVLCWDHISMQFGAAYAAKILAILTLSAGYLMVSKLRFDTFRQLAVPETETPLAVGFRILIFGVFIYGVFFSYELLALVFFGGYVVHAVLMGLSSRVRMIRRRLHSGREHFDQD